MKKLLLSLLLVTSVAHAGNLFYAKNSNGGEIVLTDERGTCAAGTNLAYPSLGSGNGVLYGCWLYQEPLVQVVYSDGSYYQYPAENFQSTQYAKQKFHWK